MESTSLSTAMLKSLIGWWSTSRPKDKAWARRSTARSSRQNCWFRCWCTVGLLLCCHGDARSKVWLSAFFLCCFCSNEATSGLKSKLRVKQFWHPYIGWGTCLVCVSHAESQLPLGIFSWGNLLLKTIGICVTLDQESTYVGLRLLQIVAVLANEIARSRMSGVFLWEFQRHRQSARRTRLYVPALLVGLWILAGNCSKYCCCRLRIVSGVHFSKNPFQQCCDHALFQFLRLDSFLSVLIHGQTSAWSQQFKCWAIEYLTFNA